MAWAINPDEKFATAGIITNLAAGATQLVAEWMGDHRDLYAIGVGDKTWAFVLHMWDGTNWTACKVVPSAATGTHGDATYQNMAEISQFTHAKGRLYAKNTHATDAAQIRLYINPMERLDVA